MWRLLIGLCVTVSAVAQAAGQSGPNIDSLVQEVRLDSLMSYAEHLSGVRPVMISDTVHLWQQNPVTLQWYTVPLADTLVYITNRDGGSNDAATYYLRTTLESFGLDSVRVDTQSTAPYNQNVIGVKTGTLDSARVYVLCAHYDGRPDMPAADDNASGTSAVLEAARLLARVETDFTILFALFDSEEVGLVGSHDFVARMVGEGQSIAGVINLDMIAWDGNDDQEFEIHTNFESSFLARETARFVTQYGLDLKPRFEFPGTRGSDQASFWDAGYPAILLIEEARGGDFNPYYHSAGDSVGHFNTGYFHEMSRLALASVASYAADPGFEPIVHIHSRVLMEGAYASADTMAVPSLFSASLPLSQPYSNPVYDGTPLDYDESVILSGFPGDSTIDWVKVSLRSDTTAASEVAGSERVALLMSGGTVADTNGMMLEFPNVAAGPYRLVVRHRNHLPIMSSDTVDTSDGVGHWDFTGALTRAYSPGPPAMKALDSGSYAMFGADANVDGQITATDFNSWLLATKAVVVGYRQSDFNLDGQVTAADFNLWLQNTKAAVSSQVPE